MANTEINTNTYWAAAPTAKAVGQAMQKVRDYYLFLNTNGMMNQWRINYNNYYGGRVTQGQVIVSGDAGQYRVLNVNHFRNLLQHIKQLIITERPAWDPRAINSDSISQKQTILARSLLDYYMREKRVERDLDLAAEFMLVFGEGFVHERWDAMLGDIEAIDPDTDEPVKAGDIRVSSYEPIDVIRDPLLREYRDREWLILRDRTNKYELAARFPEWAEKLVNVNEVVDAQSHYRVIPNAATFKSELITTYTLYHLPTEACPDGRQIFFIDEDMVLTDGPLSYKHMPVKRMCAHEIFGSPFGYTVAFDLSALQKTFDDTVSAIKSNVDTFAVNNVLVPIGGGYKVTDMGGQLKFIEGDFTAGKPETLNLLQTSAEVYSFLSTVYGEMQRISGISDVTAGGNAGGVQSGAALALKASMSIQFNQAAQGAYVRAVEDVGTGIVELMQEFAQIPRTIAIAGEYNRSFALSFSQEDFSNIDRVIVDIGNPLMQTTAGKLEVAQMMTQAGFIKMPDEMMQVIATGVLTPLTQGKQMELLQLAQENEQLKNGDAVMVVITDDHVLHINEHKSVIADPLVREDAAIAEATLNHIQEHIDFLKSPGYQELLGLMGQPQLGGGATPSAPGAGQGTVPPGGAAEPATNEMVASMQPSLPNMPNNALTGQQFNPQTGGM